MTRQSVLRHACFAFALGAFALIAVPTLGWAQDRSMDDRLDRLERDLNMLQRQVYRGGGAVGGDPGNAGNAEIRMDRLETQMRDLTGRVEEFSNRVGALQQRLEQINSDIDVRFGQMQGSGTMQGGGTMAAAAPPPGRPMPPPSRRGMPDRGPSERGMPDIAANDPGALTPPTSLMPSGTAMPPPPGPSAMFGTLSPPGSAPMGTPPMQPPQLASAGEGGARAGLPGGSPSEQYNYAFGLLKQADYPAAESALRSFVQQHPEDAMAGNAQYWLGETFYARGKYADAASAFAEGYKRFPRGAKAPDDLLKLGMALARTNQKQNACLAFGQLDRDFPNPGTSVKERVIAERHRLGC